MIVRLFCPKCTYEASQNVPPGGAVEVPLPISRPSDDGVYQVRCGKEHVSSVTLDNLKFELLFELALNALVDGYPRDAVSSFAASLERFQEFYWRVALKHLGLPSQETNNAWKAMSKQSERQLGAYVTACLLLEQKSPKLLNPNKEVRFRNNVIHDGYIPTKPEAISFGDAVMNLIRPGLAQLRAISPTSLLDAYAELSPRAGCEENDQDEISGVINILTAVDVRHPAEGNDRRAGDVTLQLDRVSKDRRPHGMELLTEEEMRVRFPHLELHPSGK